MYDANKPRTFNLLAYVIEVINGTPAPSGVLIDLGFIDGHADETTPPHV